MQVDASEFDASLCKAHPQLLTACYSTSRLRKENALENALAAPRNMQVSLVLVGCVLARLAVELRCNLLDCVDLKRLRAISLTLHQGLAAMRRATRTVSGAPACCNVIFSRQAAGFDGHLQAVYSGWNFGIRVALCLEDHASLINDLGLAIVAGNHLPNLVPRQHRAADTWQSGAAAKHVDARVLVQAAHSVRSTGRRKVEEIHLLISSMAKPHSKPRNMFDPRSVGHEVLQEAGSIQVIQAVVARQSPQRVLRGD